MTLNLYHGLRFWDNKKSGFFLDRQRSGSDFKENFQKKPGFRIFFLKFLYLKKEDQKICFQQYLNDYYEVLRQKTEIIITNY